MWTDFQNSSKIRFPWDYAHICYTIFHLTLTCFYTTLHNLKITSAANFSAYQTSEFILPDMQPSISPDLNLEIITKIWVSCFFIHIIHDQHAKINANLYSFITAQSTIYTRISWSHSAMSTLHTFDSTVIIVPRR